jgi:hypothetical protein
MTCGGIKMEIGRGFLGVLVEMNLDIMVRKEYHYHPICLEADLLLQIGSIMKVTFGYLVALDFQLAVIQNIHKCVN